MPLVPVAKLRLDGAVVSNAPAAGTVTVMVVAAPTESLMTKEVVPTETPLMESVEPVTVAVATAGLLLLTR